MKRTLFLMTHKTSFSDDCKNVILKHPNIDVFLTNKNYNHLVCLAKEVHPHYEYIVKMCNARFKIGIDEKGGHDCFDLIVETKEDISTQGIINEIEIVLDKLSGAYAG